MWGEKVVAKSYQKMTLVDEPYAKSNGRLYQRVLNESTGKIKEVRWYDEDEYYKMYPEDRPEEKRFANQKKLLGFDEGYITIFKGDIDKHEDWFNRSIARYCVHWGWYIVSTDHIPFDLPYGLTPIQLDWDKVGLSTGELKDAKSIEAYVNSLLYGSHPSTFQGNIGDRLDLNITVIKSKQKENYFGKSAEHIFEDACGNHYMWNTGAKFWAEGSIKHIKGSVKEHKVINNIQTTVLTRCIEQM